ncbi:hypothetical protein BDZ90DRAFT_260823 [Jaminaea rosea]|uniref:Uncharacterized protein n=1 Tax=Jaminaea rosea TaxID=1569628 RepID=A0A316UQU3_9BASI|nr:hypothetical protein BDZ90DRAFT_260823 [Jaminaea rosea]PWN27158.1 hypothetical protein BDZ90DRAFT_260823 [Jaminaea rosea]
MSRKPPPIPTPSSSSSPASQPSIWQAPQSRTPVPRPRQAVAQPNSSSGFHPREDVYRRRVTRPDLGEQGPPPAPWQRYSQLLGGAASLGAGAWFILWADYGNREHCFSPVRRFLGVPNSSSGTAGAAGALFGRVNMEQREKKSLAEVLEEEKRKNEVAEGKLGRQTEGVEGTGVTSKAAATLR